MCGIAGLYKSGGVAEPARVLEMARSIAHRGPDDETVERYGSPPWAVVGVRRLSLVDLEQGNQPARDDSGRYRVFMNGEVYNHRSLRAELRGSGVTFRSASDTEVVAQLIGYAGLQTALDRLHGMFALAVIDTVLETVTLVRDRAGKKPLYWTQLPDGTVAWASELRALHALPGASRRPNRVALQACLLFEYIPTPWTPWEGVQKLEPGTSLVLRAEGVQQARWWTPPVPRSGPDGDLERWSKSLFGALQVATKQRVSADVEVGYLLSGGLDSSAIVALAQGWSERPVPTFSVAVDAPGFDESQAARQVANALGTDHREARLGPEDLPRLYAAISAHMDEPLADSSLVATWRLMELVSESGLRCVLSGDGADELFAGYPTVLAHRAAPFANPLRAGLGALSRRMHTSFEGVTPDYMARRFVEGLGLPWARRHQVWMGAWLPEELRCDEAVWTVVDAHALAAAGTDRVSRSMYLDQRLYLSDGVLVKVDRASMAHGIEVRSPYLDHSIVEMSADMPLNVKLQGRERKAVLRRAVAHLLPPETLARRKQGFGTPVGPWLRGPCRHLLKDLEEGVEDLIPPDRLRVVLQEHFAGTVDHRRRLWSALILSGWRRGPYGDL